MEQILLTRQKIVTLCKNYELVLLFIVKFLFGFYVFSGINNIGYMRYEFGFLSSSLISTLLTILLGFLTALLPPMGFYFTLILMLTLQISQSLELAFLLFLATICILLLYVRIASKECILIIMTIIALHYDIPYIMPLIAGLYFSLGGIVPIIIGMFIWNFKEPMMFVLSKIDPLAEFDLMAIPQNFIDIYTEFVNHFSANTDWIYLSVLFAIVFLIVFIISKLSIDYSKEIAVVIGSFACIMGGFAGLVAGYFTINMGIVIGKVVLACLITLSIRFFDIVLDYPKALLLEFSDESNYYYVKVIPKVSMSSNSRGESSKKSSVKNNKYEDDDNEE